MPNSFTRENVDAPAPADSTAKPAAAPAQVPADTPSVPPEAQSDDVVAIADPTAAPVADPNSETPAQGAPEAEAADRPQGRARDRIEDLVAERNALRQYGEHQARVIEQLLQRQPAPQAQPVATPAVQPAQPDDAPPTLEQFEFDASKHAKAQAEWLDRQVQKRVAAAVAQTQQQQTEAQTRQAFIGRVEAFKASAPDFDAVTSNPTLPPLSQTAAKLIVASEHGPQITYHLAKHPDKAVRIARMAPEQQAMALGRLEAELASAPAATSRPANNVTKAPPALTPIPSGSGPGKDIGSMTMPEFVAHERAQAAAKRAARAKARGLR